MYKSHVGIYGSNKPSSWLPIDAWICPPLIHWLAFERNLVCTHGSVSRRAVDYVRSPFSREQWPYSTLLMIVQKIAMCGPHETYMIDGYTRTEREKRVACWSGFSLWGVYRFESPQLSDMSTAFLW
jgi:hypothetical protein